jgi:hypothetical protein
MSDTKTSIFATDHTPAEEVRALIAATGGVATSAGDDLDWTVLAAAAPSIKYSRAWLIARRWQLENFAPEELVKLPTNGTTDEEYRTNGKIISHMRNNLQLSWGEIAVRCGLAESYVRKCYTSIGVQKAIGLRIGKGGRFAYSDPTLYLENRKAEGAHIPADFKGRPAPEQLLNFKAKDGESNSATKGRAISRIVKAMALANDKATPEEQRTNINAQVAELMAKYDITVADIASWKAARAKRGKAA